MTVALSLNSSVNSWGWHSVQKDTIQVEEISFDDVLNAVNPLSHIPVVSQLTDSQPSPIASMIGGAILGGPVGLAMSAINVVFEEATGDSLIGNVVKLATGQPTHAPIRDVSAYTSLADAHKRDLNTWQNA